MGRIQVMEPDRDLDAGKTLDQVLPDGSWAGQRCFIIGGGPSLAGFDFSSLAAELVIGINRAYERLDCTVMYSMDDRFFHLARRGDFGREALERYKSFCGFRVWAHFHGEVPAGYLGVKLNSSEGLPTSIAGGLGHGNNSGYSALLLAYCLGANPIYLLGFDMKGQGKDHNWHSGYGGSAPKYDVFKKPFEKIAPAIAAAGVRVINLSPDSALEAFPKARFEDVPAERKPLFVSYYTAGNGYGTEAGHLIRSLRRWNLEHDVREISDQGNWQRNTHFKTRFLAEMAADHPGRPLVWVDCDAILAGYPGHLKTIDADAAVRFKKDELLSGVVYLAPTAAARRLVDLWAAENEANPDRWDQRNLQAVVPRWGGRLDRLPLEYCQIYDEEPGQARPIILQYQASRRLKDQPHAAHAAGAPGLVSIVMPTYNQGKYIQAAVDSILAQTYEEIELIIVDDGSTDGTAEILATLTDPRVRTLRKENGGTGSALNAGFALARGEFETWFSSDNLLYPEAIERLISALRSEPAVNFAYADADIGVMDETGEREVGRSLVSKEVGGQLHDPAKTLHYYYFGIAWVWRRSLRLRTGGEFQIGACEDYDMVLRMEEAGGRFKLVPEALAWFRRHRANLTAKTPHSTVQAIRDKAIARRSQKREEWHLAKIPKVMNFYWGSPVMPWLRLLTLETFIRHNPGWKVRLWRPTTFDETPGKWTTLEHRVPIDARDYWPEAGRLPVKIMTSDKWPGLHEVLRSDRLRWEILARDGGAWSDMDIVYLKPLSALPFNAPRTAGLDFTVSLGDFLHSIGFILAAPGNPFYKHVNESAARCTREDLYQGYGSALLNRDFKTLADIHKRFPLATTANLPTETFYAYATHVVTETLYGSRSGRVMTGPDSVGVHWYAGHPRAAQAVNVLTHENWRDADMLICEHIREALNG